MLKTQSTYYPIILGVFLFFIAGCAPQQQWTYEETISLSEQVNPLGIASNGNTIWISAPDQKKILQIDDKGNILKEFPDLERPMHISSAQGKVYIPIYLEDQIMVLKDDTLQTMRLDSIPDAPAGVWVKGDTVAIADFYNHRIILQTSENTTTIGEEGHEKGQLYYPTDVELTQDKIYVADAYNNRVQVFDYEGNVQQVIGTDDSINVATGLTVYDGHIFVTDYFNNKILIYDLSGSRTQILEGHFNKPTDIGVIDGELYIPNYGAHSIVKYTRK